ncbi:MAG: hypothetical protein U9Q07_00565 [Planctomycetota bacterium]|nr:hypothetical protein [Planctomycetota bacterium]
MVNFSFRPVLAFVMLSVVSVSLLGCSGSLAQQSQTARVAPVSEQYKLDERLQGKAYILLAETSTGQEQHRYAVSDSLALALSGSFEPQEDTKGRVNLAFLGFDGNSFDASDISSEGLDVLSFTDLTNMLNEKDLCQRHAEMKKFYQQNGMFKRADLEFLASEIGADYIILPCLLDVKRWSKGRFSVGGVRFLQTQVVSGMLGMEVWNTRTGRKVFSATSDVTLATEKIKEEPMSMEDAFTRAWYGIMKELPGQFPEPAMPPVNTAGIDNAPDLPGKDEHADTPAMASGEVAKADG